MDLAFVMAPRQNLFFVELAAALCTELRTLGASAEIHEGDFPEPHRDRVYVLVPPHEYFTLMHGRRGPTPEMLKRSIYICGEQPGTPFFEHNVLLAPRGGALFDINRHAVRAFASRGVSANHLQLGWTAEWDRLSEAPRDIDVLFMGCVSDRRLEALGRYAPAFSRRRTHLLLSDNSRPNWRASESFKAEEPKWELLRRAKVVLNLHQGESPYFEWLRIIQAISNGAVVVSEHSVDYAPLVAGRHFISGHIDTLDLLTEMVLDDGDLRWQLQRDAYAMVRESLPLASAAKTLLGEASRIARSAAVPDATDPYFAQRPPDPSTFALFRETSQPPSFTGGDENASVVRRAIKDLKLEIMDLRRDVARVDQSLRSGRPPVDLEPVRRTRGWAAVAPRVSVITALHNYERYITGALDSLLECVGPAWEVIVVDDCSTDRSRARVSEWLALHEDRAATLLHHPVNRGLGRTRNSALGWARGEYCFVLDADNEVHPHGFERLVEALDDDPGAGFAYGMLERFGGESSSGLFNVLPWDPTRLRVGNYIDAMALLRTGLLRDEMGGYCTDRRLHGWEDFDLWCGIAEAGGYGVHVPEIVARYRVTGHSMLSLTNISYTDAFSLLIARHPTVMAGMRPPT